MKKWQKLLGALLMGVTFGASLPVQAGNIPTNCVPLQTYSFRKVYCYLSPGGQQKGWIDAGDFVIVERIQDNGWAYGSYPAGSTRVKRWFRASDLVANINFANQYRYSPKNNTNVYRNSGYNSTIGSFSGNEAITVVSDNGDSRQVIYKLSNGTGYKMGWVPYWDCWSYDQVNPRATVNTQPKGNPIVTPVTRPETNTGSYGAWKATMNKRATAYVDANLTQRNGNEYADKGDTVTVLDESSKGYYVEYPLTRGGTKKRWVVRTAVTALNVSDNNNTNNTNNSTPNAFANGATKAADTIIQNNTQYQQWQGRANCKATAYDNSALTRRLGVEYVSRGDVVTVLGEAGKAYYVEYPLSRGGTKKRWVAKSAIDKVEVNNGGSVINASNISLDVPYMRQDDPQWKNVKIGSKTIYSVGCLLTCLSMKYSYQTGQYTSPVDMKSKLEFSNNDLKWGSISKHGFEVSGTVSFGEDTLSKIYNLLRENKPVIIGNSNVHWVVINGYSKNSDTLKTADFKILDPYSYTRKTLSAYIQYLNKKGKYNGRIVY